MTAVLELKSLHEIRAHVLRMARQKFRDLVIDARVQNDVDLDGAECLRITLILKSARALASRGDQLGELTLAVADVLNRQGDPRFPYLRFATRAELKELDGGND
jgi:hypothetical protein